MLLPQLTPARAMLFGGSLVSFEVFCMANYYYSRSAFKRIFVNSDPEYESLHIHPYRYWAVEE